MSNVILAKVQGCITKPIRAKLGLVAWLFSDSFPVVSNRRMDPIEYHKVFSSYLGEKIDPSTRTNARQKLTLLSENQFGELATDIHDELKRRISTENIPFLQVRSDYHPKRNQARQKLATLPEKRFKDLVIDVIIELERRFPQLVTPEASVITTNNKPESIRDISKDTSPREPQRTLIQKERQHTASTTNDLNFASLDSLMKDLGDLVTGNTEDEQLSKKTKKPTESMMSLENLPKSDDVAKLRKEKELLEKKYKLLEADFDKERSKVSICQKELNSSQIELQRAKSDLEAFNTKRGVVEKELIRVKELLENEKSKSQALEYELTEKSKSLTALESELNEKQKKLDAAIAENTLNKQELDFKTQELLKIEKEKERRKLMEQASQTNLTSEKEKTVEREKSMLVQHSDKPKNGTQSTTSSVSPSPMKAPHLPQPELTKQQLAPSINNLPWSVQRQTIIVSQILDSVTLEDLTPRLKGGVDPSRLGAYQASVDHLIETQKSGVPADILVSMKAIVIACKNITNDVEKFEQESTEHKESLGVLKTQLSTSLTHLMTAAKNHATGLAKGAAKGTSEEIDKGCSELTSVIVQILKIVKFKDNKSPPNVKDEDNIPLKKIQDHLKQQPLQQPDAIKTHEKSQMSSSDLKVNDLLI